MHKKILHFDETRTGFRNLMEVFLDFLEWMRELFYDGCDFYDAGVHILYKRAAYMRELKKKGFLADKIFAMYTWYPFESLILIFVTLLIYK